VDDRHFDAFARAMAGRATRRETLRRGAALAAAPLLAVLRGDSAAARHARISLGGACRHTNQCLHHAPAHSGRRRPDPQWVYCAENGFRYDGHLNCCRNEGGTCERDEECCGDRHFCRRRVCAYLR
jgi:hypothetical protein